MTESTPPANNGAWGDPLGNATSANIAVDVETQSMVKVVGGRRVRHTEDIGENYTATIRIDELNKDVVDLIFASAKASPETDTFVSAGATRRVWIRMQSMDSGNNNRVLLQGVGLFKPTGDISLGGENFFGVDFEMEFSGQVSGSLIGSFSS